MYNINGGAIMIEFELELYYKIYRDTPMINRNRFKEKFIKKHGNFQYLPELILMIENYQRKKYGNLLDDFIEFAPSKYGSKERRY